MYTRLYSILFKPIWLQERVIYNKEVQTMDVESEPEVVNEDEIRERIIREREAAEAERIAHEQELEAESKKLDEEIAQEIRGMRYPCVEFQVC